MLVVIAMGANALPRHGQPTSTEVQRASVAVAAAALAPILRDHQVVITHGSGPRVGLLPVPRAAVADAHACAFHVLDAEGESGLGYLLELAIGRQHGFRNVATVITQVVVDSEDPAFADAAWRRVVPSPEPQTIVEVGAIKTLLDNGYVVICAGGGGIPVTLTPDHMLTGCEAVIDKDLVSARLASDLGAEALLLLSDVDGVYADWGQPSARRIEQSTVAELRAMSFPSGSMGPKVEALCRFADDGGRIAAIGSLAQAGELLSGTVGTRVTSDVVVTFGPATTSD